MANVPYTKDLFDLTHSSAGHLLACCLYPWEALSQIRDFILAAGAQLSPDEYDHPAEDVWIAKSASVAPTAYIKGPCIIEADAEVRHCAFIRGAALIGRGSVLGNSCEMKNAVLFDSVQVPHFNYVGDSILGYKAHMGAGSITSNVKSDRTDVTVKTPEEQLTTGIRKFGAILGDYVEVGCNSVLNPGTIICPHTNIYPLSSVRGVVPPDSIYKGDGRIIKKY